MPKRIFLSQGAKHSGIDITWTPDTQRLAFGGWYDTCVGLAGGSFTLREFFDALGISARDCAKAWKPPKEE